jgi:hypothetical protein
MPLYLPLHDFPRDLSPARIGWEPASDFDHEPEIEMGRCGEGNAPPRNQPKASEENDFRGLRVFMRMTVSGKLCGN